MERKEQTLCRLHWARAQLLVLRDNITRDVAPGTAKKIRSAIKSIDGAIRNANRFQDGAIRNAKAHGSAENAVHS